MKSKIHYFKYTLSLANKYIVIYIYIYIYITEINVAWMLISQLGQLENKRRASQAFGPLCPSYKRYICYDVFLLGCMCRIIFLLCHLNWSLNCREARWFNRDALSVSMSQFSARCCTLWGQRLNFYKPHCRPLLWWPHRTLMKYTAVLIHTQIRSHTDHKSQWLHLYSSHWWIKQYSSK